MINWGLRLKNKTTLITLITALIALVYQILGACGVVPAVTQDTAMSIVGMVVNALCVLGIVVDPTTKGVGDSARALSYQDPASDAGDDK